jgi:DNA-binding NtrC family response regulator
VTTPLRVLVVDDDEGVAEVLSDTLGAAGHQVEVASSLGSARAHLKAKDFDVLVLDLTLPDGSGLELLRQVKAEGLALEVIVLTGNAEVGTAIEAMKLGAYDYLAKPPRTEEFEVLVTRAGEKTELRGENASLRVRLARQESYGELLSEDPAMKGLFALLARAATSDLPILIQGETGTGKELVARAVHSGSPRSAFPFVAVNCAAVPEGLIESELFGHEKGAFTGAADRRPGLFEVAGLGVIFLDEIGEVTPAVQARLLRVLESREFFRLGGTRVVRTNARVVTATNKNLHDEVEGGRFREDLFYRLDGITLKIPPLRDRPRDVLLLAEHFLAKALPRRTLSPEALEALQAYRWPGNVRELRMVVERAVILAPLPEIQAADLRLGGPRRSGGADAPWSTDLTLAEMERTYIEAVLKKHSGHRGNAARALGIDPKTLYNKLGPEKIRE